MGNYGNTLDRWYRRAAVIVWPRRNDFAVRADASPGWALTTLSTSIRAGDAAQARRLAVTVAPFWSNLVGATLRADVPDATSAANAGTLFTRALQVADGLDEPALAAMVLTPFRVELLAPAHAPTLAGLAQRYGQRWTTDLLAAWSPPRSPWARVAGPDRLEWITSVPALCAALCAAGDTGAQLAEELLAQSWSWLVDAIDTRRQTRQPSRREQALIELAKPIAALLTGIGATDVADLRDRAISYLCADGQTLLRSLTQVLHDLADAHPTERAAAGLDILTRHCIRLLEARLTPPPRSPDNWSIDPPAGCDCELCNTLARFLTDPARREFDWPLAEQKRRHVHERIDNHELPVGHQTRRVGRPYTLALTKTPALFDREAAARRQDQADLTWLRDQLP